MLRERLKESGIITNKVNTSNETDLIGVGWRTTTRLNQNEIISSGPFHVVEKNNFNKKIEKEFVIINYRQAMALLGKKYSLSDSTTQIVEQFAKTFKKIRN